MATSKSTAGERIVKLTIGDASLTVRLADGRELTVPLAWYPRLLGATPEQRANWELCGAGYGVHWPDIDEDLSSEGLLRGFPGLPTAEMAESRDLFPPKLRKLVGLAVVVLVLVAGVALWADCSLGAWGTAPASISLLLLGIAVGVLTGSLASPYGTERPSFNRYAGLVATFASGYVVGELGPAAKLVFEEGILFTEPTYGIRFVLMLAVAAIAGIFTYAYRSYASHRRAKDQDDRAT